MPFCLHGGGGWGGLVRLRKGCKFVVGDSTDDGSVMSLRNTNYNKDQ